MLRQLGRRGGFTSLQSSTCWPLASSIRLENGNSDLYRQESWHRTRSIADGSITRCHWESQRYTSAIGAPSWFQHSAWCRNGDIFSEIRRGCPAGAYSTGPFSREARGIGRLG